MSRAAWRGTGISGQIEGDQDLIAYFPKPGLGARLHPQRNQTGVHCPRANSNSERAESQTDVEISDFASATARLASGA